MSEELRYAMSACVVHLNEAGPRRVRGFLQEDPCIIFVDGACEDITSAGAVLLDPRGSNEFWGGILDAETVDTWKTKLFQKQVIGQAELIPLLVSRLTWEKKLAGRRVLFFMDNESARICAIKSYSPVLPSLEIVMQCIGIDYAKDILAWYARVPTCCNIADGPSRMDSSEAVNLLGAKAVPPVCPKGVVFTRVLV